MIKYIVIHHTAVSYLKNPDQWKATDAYHKQELYPKSSLGFFGGYNYEISMTGSIKQFRTDGEKTAAQIGHNHDSISICMDGDFSLEDPTLEQVKSLTMLVKQKMTQYLISAENVWGHRYFATYTAKGLKFIKNNTLYQTWDGCKPYKMCPGTKLSDQWIKDIIKFDRDTDSQGGMGVSKIVTPPVIIPCAAEKTLIQGLYGMIRQLLGKK